VTCHDLDAFACVMTPASAPQPWLLRQAVSRTMDGLRRAAAVVCVSHSVRDALIQRGLAASERTVVVANGVHPAFMGDPPPNDRADADRLLDGAAGRRATVDLLHVGIPVERKRIDVALRVLARLRTARRDARLVRVGGALPPGMRELARRLGVFDHVVELPFLSPGVLAAVYRRAGVLLVPSDREGFALPIVESLACGTPVIARRVGALPEIIREGTDGFFGDDPAQLAFVVDGVDGLDRAEIRRSVVDRFSAQRMTDAYERLYRRRLEREIPRELRAIAVAGDRPSGDATESLAAVAPVGVAGTRGPSGA
jgi:glycosyltransferase involved in cell wall biosynthesis